MFTELIHTAYGSITSRNPSPTKLKHKTEIIINSPGISIHGYSFKTCTLCAWLRRRPQLVMGGFIPNPKKLKELSAIIIIGIRTVAVTIIWLAIFGII
jgi:hypothetical protein